MIRKISEAIQLLIANFTLFSQIILTVWLPGSIIVVLFGAKSQSFPLLEFGISDLIELTFGAIYVSALFYALSNIKQGLNVNYRDAMSHGNQRGLKLLATRISTNLILFLGFIAFIIPGIIWSLRFALVDMVVALEGTNGLNARKRSIELTKGKLWKILGAATVTMLGILIFDSGLSSFLYFPLSIIRQAENFPIDLIIGLNFIIGVIYLGIVSIANSVLYIVLFLYYWESKEHFKLVNEESEF